MSSDCEYKTIPKGIFANYTFPGEFKNYPIWETAIKIAIVSIVAIVAILGNILIIFIVLRSKKMRTPTNYYIMNLSFADLLIACFPIWIHLVDDVTEGWVVGAYFCKFNPFIQITAMCASIFTLVAIASDRFFAIMFPLKHRITQRKVGMVMAAVWTCAVAIGTPALFFYKYNERQWKDFLERFCTDVWPQIRNSEGLCDKGYQSKSAYWVCVLVVLNWVPMIIMLVVYTIILIRLGKRRIIPSSGALSSSAIQQRSKTKVVMMLFAILIAFIVCAVPFQVSVLYSLFRKAKKTGDSLPDWYNTLYFVAVTLLYTNSALNPIIYSGLNENFKNSFKSLVKTFFKIKQEPSRSKAGKSAVHEMTSHSHKPAAPDVLSIDSRQGSKTSVIEGLAQEQPDKFRYSIGLKSHLTSFRNSIP